MPEMVVGWLWRGHWVWYSVNASPRVCCILRKHLTFSIFLSIETWPSLRFHKKSKEWEVNIWKVLSVLESVCETSLCTTSDCIVFYNCPISYALFQDVICRYIDKLVHVCTSWLFGRFRLILEHEHCNVQQSPDLAAAYFPCLYT